jgi:hypothetical protein
MEIIVNRLYRSRQSKRIYRIIGNIMVGSFVVEIIDTPPDNNYMIGKKLNIISDFLQKVNTPIKDEEDEEEI